MRRNLYEALSLEGLNLDSLRRAVHRAVRATLTAEVFEKDHNQNRETESVLLRCQFCSHRVGGPIRKASVYDTVWGTECDSDARHLR